ncbi:MAG: DUF1343 domain-containing protein [Verrucomicrobiota bacterium]|nr:DUF1343 domain-containing protein [Verrucomicrobiota bacterium]
MTPRLKKFFFASAFVLLATVARGQVDLGIDVLAQHNFAILEGKRIGLVTNQTGVNAAGVRTRLVLKRASNVKLVALFTPEHGLDGTELAGKYVATRRDSVTGLVAHSLYGPTRKPTPQMLEGIDALVFDMQDIGSRSYTYISTMAKCMEAAGEKGIQFIVLDRPNPLGGVRIEGPGIDSQWISFVGQLPVPYVHGMTVGELARMANAEGWVQPRCDLRVVNMRGWSRQMVWPDTGLRWVPTSPNIPRATSPLYYVATGIVGELPALEIGIGTSEPFELVSAKWLNAECFTSEMRALQMPGVTFTPYNGGGYEGSRIRIESHSEANLCALGIHILAVANRAARPDLFSRSASKLEMFYKCYGSSGIRAQIMNGIPVSRIVAGWSAGLSRFQSQRQPYLLY